MYQDTHIHIQDIKNPAAITEFIKSCCSAGFQRFFDCAITPADWPIIKELAEKNPEVVPFYGIHPWFSDIADKGWQDKLAGYLASPNALAGEMGLDHARKNIDFELQKEIFIGQLELARKFNKPFAVHCVRAWGEVIESIKQHAPGSRFLMHSFNGSKEIAQEILAMGGYISISAKQFQRLDDSFKDALAIIPVNRTFIETDFPYQIKWTTPNEYIQAVRKAYETIASQKGLEVAALGQTIFDNGRTFSSLSA